MNGIRCENSFSRGTIFNQATSNVMVRILNQASRWEKIVVNLISNAFKFTREGSISVYLTEAGEEYVLTVTDTGAGIPKSELQTIFKRFHRVKAEGARTHEGSGIGLSMVSELTKLHGGTVLVESEPGKGSIFTVKIPVGNAHLPANQVVEETGAALPVINNAMTYVQEASAWTPSNENTKESNKDVTQQTVYNVGQSILVADDNVDMRAYLAPIKSVLDRCNCGKWARSIRPYGGGAARSCNFRRDDARNEWI